MIGKVSIQEKSFGNKTLVKNIDFTIEDNQKIGVVGRNGVGKSTLFHILAGEDKDFIGDINFKKGIKIVSTSQEHHGLGDMKVVDYVLGGIPEYSRLNDLIETLPDTMGDDVNKIEQYTDALDKFNQLGFYNLKDLVVEELKNFGLKGFSDRKLKTLSGGQRRMLEIIKIMHSQAHLALIDEPTNHMDYIAKDQFINWMKSEDSKKTAMLIITHDRDVLLEVDRIIELKDGFINDYKGNYEDYLRQNVQVTSTGMNDFDQVKKRITNLKQKVIDYRRLKEKSRNPGTIQKFKRLENESRKELEKLEEVEKPTFWVDKSSAEKMNYKVADQYQKYKSKNIKMNIKSDETKNHKHLISASNLSLGYGEKILFEDINLSVSLGDIVELRGPNGAGKSTLIKFILNKISDDYEISDSLVEFDGNVTVDEGMRVGVYEQEIDEKYLKYNLREAIENLYLDKNMSIDETKIRKLASDYLFEVSDLDTPISRLSGGQKARFQIISMLANDPQLLILDEPTNHLDLPSIEELETALQKYSGAVLYVSHDNYFRKVIGGNTINIG